MRFGYHLSSEEHPPQALLRSAVAAEELGFDLALISDHFHPWLDAQGQSPFVWSVLGSIAVSTKRLRVGTAVTCPTMRYHPALIAQAAATVGSLFQGRFFLGLGTGEYLNEHIYGGRWPAQGERTHMLEEALQVIRGLWQGRTYSHRGSYFTVDSARIYSLPEPLPPIYLAAGGKSMARRTATMAEGLIGVAPDASLVDVYRQAGGRGYPICGKVMVCWASTFGEAASTVKKWWPIAGMDQRLSTELRSPSHFEAVVRPIRQADLRDTVAMGPDVERHLEAVGQYVKAGFNHIVLHQIGPDQDGFFHFWRDELGPAVRSHFGAEAAAKDPVPT